ncbi:MAG: ADP-forming succinate--CoA ligase subunit beta [Sedimentisphaerales bacterium]|nr:ADP-forming succinate--CoA ligase subunit beta [Sedimentisphaerales bacterium]
MKIYEYQGRELLQQYGIAVPEGELASTPEQAAQAAAAWGGKAMIKGQVLTGGRGKAGAVRAVSSKKEAESVARDILAISVKDFPVKQLLITEMLEIQAEYYAAITVDREAKSVVLIISAAGGMDIEEVALQESEKIRRFEIPYVQESDFPETLKQWLSISFPDQALCTQAVQIVQSMYRLFRDKDCSLVEINPLAHTAQSRLVAADAKIVFDDNGIEKHPDIGRLSNPEEYTADELEARAAGLSFVSLSGEIGCMVNGAGLAMATMDGIKLAGSSPANFLDVGGSSNPQKVLDAMRILLRNKQLKVILINIFGGITRCDDIAQGILWARNKLGITVPIIIRLIGTNEEKGRNMLNEAGLIVTRYMTDAIHEAVNCTRKGPKS